MIELKVEPRCHECPEFEPTVATVNSLYADERLVSVDTIIKCKHKQKCDNLLKYIKEEIKNDDNTTNG